MADEDGLRPSSPEEDYDPLTDDLNSRHGMVGSHSPDTESSNEEGQEVPRGQLDLYPKSGKDLPYSITPPVSSRLNKRDKIKSRGKQSYREYKMHAEKRKKLPRTVVSIIRGDYAETQPSLFGLTGVDSDDNFETRESVREQKEKKRKESRERSKTTTTNRAHDRFVKRHSDDLTSLATSTVEAVALMQTVSKNLESSGRFRTLAARQLPVSVTGGKSESRRLPSSSKIECPSERLSFSKTFTALINMGSQGKREKEKKEKEKLLSKRQISSDEEMWLNFIWMELQAWQSGCSLQDQEIKISMKKEKIPRVLDEVLHFRVDFSNIDSESIGNGVLLNRSISHASSNLSTHTSSTDISVSYTTMFLTNITLSQQREALIQVKNLLDKLDKCEQLFPTSRAFAREFPLYGDKKFVCRLKSLNLWLNITHDLCHKLKLLGKLFNAHTGTGSNWPNVNLEGPECCDRTLANHSINQKNIPIIEKHSDSDGDDIAEREDGEEAEEESDQEVKKYSDTERLSTYDRRVKFTFDSDRSSRDTSPVNLDAPSDTSTPYKNRQTSPVNDLSRASSEASLDDPQRSSVYRNYVDKSLKRIGLSKMILRLRDILNRSLQRAKDALEMPRGELSISDSVCKSPTDEYSSQMSSSPSLELLDRHPPAYSRSTSLTDFGAWSEQFLDIGLPSFRPSYLFLVRILLDVIHDAMILRLEQLENPIKEPSFLSLRQLIRECKDMLSWAVMVKQYYQYMVAAVLCDDEMAEEASPMDLEEFDSDMSRMFKIYFQYLQNWLYMLQNVQEASHSLKNPLEEEWSFTKKICPYVIGGEAEAGRRFSTLAISLLNSISDFLEAGIDEYTTSLYDWSVVNEDEDEESENQTDDSDDDNPNTSHRKRTSRVRQTFQQTCRNFKNLFHEARERASKALGFAKMLRKDLEIAADFNIAVDMPQLLQKLHETKHVRVIAPVSAGYLMFIPVLITHQNKLILQLLNVTCGREDITIATADIQKEEGYLLMVRSDGDEECPNWKGDNVEVEPTAETAIALSHLTVEALLLVVIHSSHLTAQRKEFENLMGNTVELVNEQTSCHEAIAESLLELKEAAISLRDKVATAIKQVDEKWNCGDIAKMEESEKNHILKLYRETMLQAYNFGFEYMREVTRLVSGEMKAKLGWGLVSFAKDWMKFVSEKCETGRGMRPRWASQGLEFLIVVCDPKILALLNEEEFQDLQQCINDSISHLIGNAVERSTSWNPTMGIPKVATSSDIQRRYDRFPSWPTDQGRIVKSKSMTSESVPKTPSVRTPLSSPPPTEFNIPGFFKTRDRVMSVIEKLENERLKKLQEKRVIGRVTGRRSEVSYHTYARKVNFRWHKGNKIGEGQFGKVYCAVNMDTGELMAMKEMKFVSNDMQAVKDILDEIKIFEGIRHENIVRYYGVEVHRDDMLVFMEYCDRGTIEEVAKLGLPEDMIRYYTKQLLIAVNVLHENGIVHRDIKGANVFLTSSGKLKLGDFGCSVKLKSHSTLPGEINTLVGTTAYMAPEVITRNDQEGHGRAADIWSLGCVVIEMSSGKRPWHELESNYQIMWKVGMGETPAVPESIGAEGRDFLSHCFEHEAKDRWTASQLLDHPFVRLYDEPEQEGASALA
ncbi:hypothetical protein ACJMK2_028357 [Sinanodonta woodiana]|uniref:Mitogen-activated protein kinase kinase kinase 4 n=1 Tax=Sinanodonta woodiana TaxID=1069815 RepID=A0ABD3X769_SINWO